MIKRIISGGQTGADRAALDFTIDKDISVWESTPEPRFLANQSQIIR